MPDSKNERQTIPESVLDALALVRSEGPTNMFDRNAVIYWANELGDDDADQAEAVIWLHDNTDRYMEALNAMGKRVANA